MSQSPNIQYHQVDSARVGQRLDNYLLRLLKGLPKSYLYKIIRSGEVRVNKKRIKPDYRIMAEDIIRIPPIRYASAKDTVKNNAQLVSKKHGLRQQIIYEDEQVIVMNKTSGLPVHAGSGSQYGLIELMRAVFPDYHYLELVHRLDKATSGCLLLAKDARTLKCLHQQMIQQQFQKYYLTLVRGHWPKKRYRVSHELCKQKSDNFGAQMKVSAEAGKSAVTLFKPLKYYHNTSLLEVQLLTGRTHQIRVHCATEGHPIAGDDKYGDKLFNKQLQQQGLRRLFLHAWKIGFTLPDGKNIQVEAPLPKELENFKSKE